MTDRLADWEALALAHANGELADGLRTAIQLDRRMARIVATANEPMLAQIRMTWWREQLGAASSNQGEAISDPLLADIASVWSGQTVELTHLIDAWEGILLSDSDGLDGLPKARAAIFGALAERFAGEQYRDPAQIHGFTWGYAELNAIIEFRRSEILEKGLNAARRLEPLPRNLRSLAFIGGLSKRALQRGGKPMFGDRFSPLVALRLGIFGT